MFATDVTKAAEIIKNGGIVAFPTETVYGLGANALDATAVAKIFAAKQRPSFDPLIIHIHDINQLSLIACNVPEMAQMLISKFWPGPLTIVVPKSNIVPDIVTSGLPNVGIRMPSHKIALDLIQKAGTPIAAPSANKFGHISPTCADHVREQLNYTVDAIIDGGTCSVGIESTIVSFIDKVPLLLRPGGLAIEEIEEVIGPIHIPGPFSFTNASPGRSLRHYAPGIPLFIGASPSLFPGLRKGLISFIKEDDHFEHHFDKIEILSTRGDLNEAACNLFAAIRRLDEANLNIIIAKLVPNYGLGVAINDRLKRASKPLGKIVNEDFINTK